MPAALEVADVAVGAGLVVGSIVAAARRPSSRVGLLLAVAGATWFAGDASRQLLYLHRGALVLLLLAYPTGRLRGWTSRATVAVAYATAAVRPWARNDTLTIAVAMLVAVTAAGVFVPTLGRTRRALLPALGAALAFAAMLAVAASQRLAGWDFADGVAWAYDIVVLAVALILVVDLVRGRWGEAVVSGLVVDLGGRTGTEGLRGALGRALGDRSLAIGYWSPEARCYVDESGATLGVDELAPGRVATPIGQGGEPLAVLVHDAAVLDDPAYVQSVTAAAQLAVSSARLADESHGRIEALAASRRRIVRAADAQRERLGRELRYGTQVELTRVAELLKAARCAASRSDPGLSDRIAHLEEQLSQARDELDQLAQGIHPLALVDGGLAAALPTLADRAGVPVSLDVHVGPLPGPVEAALYFVCAEALTNAAKYAHANNVAVEVSGARDAARVEIADDGIGGADAAGGSGLRGLADRIETLGGTLAVDSPPGLGTRVRAVVPTSG